MNTFFPYWLLLCYLFSSNSFAASTPQANPPKKLTYEDRAQWQAFAETHLTPLELDNLTLDVTQFPAPITNSNKLIVWLGDTAQPNDGLLMALQSLRQAQSDSQLWFIDLPEALFMERSRQALRNQSGQWATTLIRHLSQNFDDIWFVSSDVTVIPLFRGLRQWQQQAPTAQRHALKGLILLYPNFYRQAPIAGETPELLPIVSHSALPIHIIQPRLGAQANTIERTRKALQQGGSWVQLSQVPAATDFYFFYENIRQSAPEAGQAVAKAIDQLAANTQKIGYYTPKLYAEASLSSPPKSRLITGLKTLTQPKPMPNIRLQDISGKWVDVKKDYAGKPLLINFWATWCPHCVEEIPSMNRALKQLAPEGFEIVSISYKDTHAIMHDFLKDVPVDFPVLMDLDGQVSAEWQLFSFPSSFLVDRQGRIRYSINAGSLWDAPEMLAPMQALTEEK